MALSTMLAMGVWATFQVQPHRATSMSVDSFPPSLQQHLAKEIKVLEYQSLITVVFKCYVKFYKYKGVVKEYKREPFLTTGASRMN